MLISFSIDIAHHNMVLQNLFLPYLNTILKLIVLLFLLTCSVAKRKLRTLRLNERSFDVRARSEQLP